MAFSQRLGRMCATFQAASLLEEHARSRCHTIGAFNRNLGKQFVETSTVSNDAGISEGICADLLTVADYRRCFDAFDNAVSRRCIEADIGSCSRSSMCPVSADVLVSSATPDFIVSSGSGLQLLGFPICVALLHPLDLCLQLLEAIELCSWISSEAAPVGMGSLVAVHHRWWATLASTHAAVECGRPLVHSTRFKYRTRLHQILGGQPQISKIVPRLGTTSRTYEVAHV